MASHRQKTDGNTLKRLRFSLPAVIRRAAGGLLLAVLSMWPAGAAEALSGAFSTADHSALPPQVVENAPPANVLLILDNSNRMDLSADDEPVGSHSDASRSEIARQALKAVIRQFGGDMRIGLMSFRLPEDAAPGYLHSLMPYASYNPQTYDDDRRPTPFDPATNARRRHNSSYAGEESPPYEDGDHFIYHDLALARYLPSEAPDLFCYSTRFVERSAAPAPDEPAGCSQNWYDSHLCSDNPYRCHTQKFGVEDVSATDGGAVPPEQPAVDAYGGLASEMEFRLTETEAAGGIFQLGVQLAMVPVGSAWVSRQGAIGGDLVVEIGDPDPERDAQLSSRLARVEKFSEPYDMQQTMPIAMPIRNAGRPPLAYALDSARDYYSGSVDRHQAHLVYRSPIVAPCQKNFVILITGGLTAIDAPSVAVEAAAALRSTEAVVDGEPFNFDIQTFVLAITRSAAPAGAADPIAVAGGTDADGRSGYAPDLDRLTAALSDIFQEIRRRSAHGSSASVLSASRMGEGALYQTVFYPNLSDGRRSVRWAGDIRALFVDRQGRLHESQPDADGSQSLQAPLRLPTPSGDPVITFCRDDTEGIVRVHKAYEQADIPAEGATGECDREVFRHSPEDIRWLWSGGQWLAGVVDAEKQRPYSSPLSKRYIFTAVEAAGGNGRVPSAAQRPFLPSTFTSQTAGLLQVSDKESADAVVNYIRGKDQPGLRSRQIDVDGDGLLETWRLGDIVNAAPAIVQRPLENLDLLYGDESYRHFAAVYRNRRVVLYTGANDGMFHAFNGGWYDAGGPAFRKQDPEKDAAAFELGAELWAYVPYNLLPHLRYITDPDYGEGEGRRHYFLVDLEPVVFDACIFGPGGVAGQDGVDHPGGWGTLVVGGMGLGGREITVDANPTSPGEDVRTLRSAMFIIDVTDPEHPPKLLLEFSHPVLGFTTSRPTPLKAGNDWYLMIGSGPFPADSEALAHAGSRQNGKLFLIDLKKMALEEGFGNSGVLTIDQPDSFVSDLVAVDYDLDQKAYSSDAVYFGTVSGNPERGWSGSLMRLRISAADGGAQSALPVGQWGLATLLESGTPIAKAPAVGVDQKGQRWVYAGSGRYFTPNDAVDCSRQSVYGVIEPFLSLGDTQKKFTWGSVALESLEDVTDVEFYLEEPEEKERFDALGALISDRRGGWLLRLADDGERCLRQPSLLGDMLTFSTWTPSTEMCHTGGSSRLYSLSYTRGGAYYRPVMGTEIEGAEENGTLRQRVLKKRLLGQGIAGAPALNRTTGGDIRALVSLSSGKLVSLAMSFPGPTASGPIFWNLWAP